MVTQSSRITYYQDDDFHLEVEKWGMHLFLHCSIFNWKLSVLKKIYRVFGRLKTEAQTNDYTALVTVTSNPKFAELFGGVQDRTVTIDNKIYEVLKWELTQSA